MSKMASREYPGNWVNDVENFANSVSHDAHNVEEYVKEISKKFDRHSAIYETRADIYKLWRATEGNSAGNAKADIPYFFVSGLSSAPLAIDAALSHSSSAHALQDKRRKAAPVNRAHRIMWLVLVLFSAIWGIVAGASLAASIGVPQDVALFGLIGNAVLGLSLFRLGKAADWKDR